MKYDIITGANERILVTQVNATIAKEKTVKILDAPFAVLDPDSTGASRLMWCQAILIGETNTKTRREDSPTRIAQDEHRRVFGG